MDFFSLNWLLFSIAILLVINVINGFKKGFVKELINCISLAVLSLLIVLLSAVLKDYTTRQFVQMIMVIIMILALILAFKLIKMALDGVKVLASLPVISGVNKLLGGIFGVAETLVVVWFAFCLIGMFDLGVVNEYIYTYIHNSEILAYLYEHNMIAILGEKIMGPEFQLKAMDVILNQGLELTESLLK